LHPPVRLQIAAILAQVHDAEFALLKSITSASDSVMSKHLSALAEAGYVSLRKANSGGRQRTWASLTGSGRAALRAHVNALETLASTVVEAASGERESPEGVQQSA
jgi:DNA-binding MarR family transcriptional regulator